MVCTTITVLELKPAIALLAKGLLVNDAHPSQCVALVGAKIGFWLNLTLVYSQNIYAKVDVSLTTPAGTKIVTYSSLILSVGTKEYFLGYTAETYQPGTYSIGAVIITPN